MAGEDRPAAAADGLARPRGRTRWRLATTIVATTLVIGGLGVVEAGPAAALQPDQPAGCPVVVSTPAGNQYYAEEKFPPAGLPRDATPVPYGIPFAGQMNDGTLKVGPGGSTVLGPAKANLCGLLALPNNTGTSTEDQLLVTNNPVPVNLGSTMGIELFSAYIELTADVTAQLSPKPAANGGVNLTLRASFAGTLVPQAGFSGLLTTLGITSLPGVGPISGSVPLPVNGFECTTLVGPITFTTATSGSLTGKALTGKLSDAQTSLVANDFEYPAIQASTPPVTTTPAPPAGSCSPAAAQLLNTAVGLPEAAGGAQFTADATFSVHVTQ